MSRFSMVGRIAGRNVGRVAGLLLAVLLVLSVSATQTWAQSSDGDIELLSSEVTSEFQEGIRFEVDVRSAAEIEEMAVRFRIGQREVGAYEYLEPEEAGSGESVKASVFYRTNTAARYIAPGTIITYNFEITDVKGNRLDTPEYEYIYHDDRYEWDEISNGIVTVSYHGPVSFRAEDVLEATVQTLEVMGPLLGAGVDDPIRITMYNNWPEMRPALPPASDTSRRELITEGQAHSPEGVLLVLGGAPRASGVASHEVTHILVHRAGEGRLGRVPSWLNEGLAEFGNIQPGESYDRALAYAVRTNNLLPITGMEGQPGTPEDVIIFYGQARSIVSFMIEEYGAEKMRELMATIKSGRNYRNAIPLVYGMEPIELENLWRDRLGVERRQLPSKSDLPTPLPTAALGLLSLDDLRKQGSGGATAVPAAATAAPESTATPQPVATPEAEPTEIPQPTVAPTAPPAARAEQVAGTAVAALSEMESEEGEQGGGSCGVPANGGVVEMSSIALVVGLGWLWMRRRARG